MVEKDIDNLLSSIEEEFSDELDTLLLADLSQFSTEYLQELKAKWQERYRIHKELFRRLLWIGATSPVWLVIGLLGMMFTDNFWLPKIALLFPVSVIWFIVGLFYLHNKFGGRHKQDYIGRLINNELERRKSNGYTRSKKDL